MDIIQEQKQKFQEKIKNMDAEQFEQFTKTMYRTFNFLCVLEDMDIEQVYILQNNEPTEHNISMTAKEFCEAFEKYTNLDVE